MYQANMWLTGFFVKLASIISLVVLFYYVVWWSFRQRKNRKRRHQLLTKIHLPYQHQRKQTGWHP
jgi:preprotein translocase subunit YajC